MRGLIGVLAAVVCLAGAGSAAAAVTFGPDLTVGDAGQGTACSSYTYPSGLAPSSCVAALVLGDSYAPVKGVITSFSIRMATPVTGRLRTAHVADNSQPFISDMTMLTTGGDVSVPGDSAVHSFPVRLPIAKGDVIAFASTVAIYRNNQGRSYARRVSRDSPDGSTAEMPTMGAGEVASEEVPINATIEGDADGDGYGDETQDMCPTIASTHDACPGTVPPPPAQTPPPDGGGTNTPPPAPDTFAPVLSPVAFSHKSFRFAVSEPGNARFTIYRLRQGKRAGRRCVAPPPRRSHGKACTKKTRMASFTKAVAAGRNAIPFPLRRGRYRVEVQTSDPAGNRSNLVAEEFTLKR